MRIFLCGVFAALFGISGLTHADGLDEVIPGQGTWETTLLGRDINGHPVPSTDASAVFAYDTVLDVTWLLTGNFDGLNWGEAKAWAAGLTVGTFSGWKLPTADEDCSGYNCTNSQVGKLWYETLGNVVGQPVPKNYGPFKNPGGLLGFTSWTSMEVAAYPDYAWFFYFSPQGYQLQRLKWLPLGAIALRPGDVLAVPEPGTYAMLLAGLLALGAVRRRKAARLPGRRASLLAVIGTLATVAAGTAHAAAVPGQGTWETTLLGRNISGYAVPITDPSAKFAYDTVLDATWLLTANNTRFYWGDAMSWAAGLTVGTFSGWTLPSTDTVCGYAYNCTGSQLGELYYTALGNVAGGPLSNTGPFKNLESYLYWSSTEYLPYPGNSWGFGTYDGIQNAIDIQLNFLFALAIRPGDVLVAVPEPGTYAMLLAGLFGLFAVRRRKVARVPGRRTPPLLALVALLVTASAGTANAAAVPGQGTWETTLLGRDINGHPIAATDSDAVFAYDTVLDATWYLTANNNPLNWYDAKSWAAGLTVGSFSGWSLPAADPSCYDYYCTNSQMGELYYTALGNVPYIGVTNTGPFKNLLTDYYWADREYAPEPIYAWFFNTQTGFQPYDPKTTEGLIRAIAIRPGDVAAVPEPGTYAMLLAGLVGLVGMRRRKAARIPGRRASLLAAVGLLVTGAANAAAVPGQGTWETTLLGRDINGHAVAITDPNAEFAYDTVLDATWYLTPNNTGSFGLTWDGARSWAAGLTVGTFGGWSLPAADPTCLGFYECTGSQMGELHYLALGNVRDRLMSNTGPFKSPLSSAYWAGMEYAPSPDLAWYFVFDNYGFQGAANKLAGLYALAIRPGDLFVPVPEPGTYAMLLAGLVGLMTLRWRKAARATVRRTPWLAVVGMLAIVTGTAHAAAVPGQGTWETTLLGRDINGHPIAATDPDAVFAYDTMLNVTWYLTAYNGNGYGGLDWPSTLNWASELTLGTFGGWSLPSAYEACDVAPNCTESQMGALYYTALGNPAGGPLSNTGPFRNLVADVYWSSTEYARSPGFAWTFGIGNGFQYANSTNISLLALAVRPGDVAAAVPEPGTYAMLLAGLAGLVALRRRRVAFGAGRRASWLAVVGTLAIAIAGTAQAAAVPGLGTWETTLLGRDINGHAVAITDPSAEFAYDTVLDATWYLTGNNTGLNWGDAKNWAAGLTVGTFSGWSLPAPDPVCGLSYYCTNSQMGELYYTALGNQALQGPPSNTGPFKNLQSGYYWSSTEYRPGSNGAWYFETYNGIQFSFSKGNNIYALAIRPGDLLVPVPEPETYAMLLAGLVGLIAVRRRS